MLIGGKDFLDLYRLRYQEIRSLEGAELVASLRGWFGWLRSTQASAEVLDELMAEVHAAVPKYGALCGDARTTLVDLSAAVATATPDLDQPIQARTAHQELLLGARDLVVALEELSDRARDPKLPSNWALFPESPDAAFKHLIGRTAASESFADREVRKALIERVQNAQWRIQVRFASLMMQLATSGGHSLAVFQFLMRCIGVECDEVPLQNAGLPSVDPVASIMTAVFGPQEVTRAAAVPPEALFPREMARWEPLFRRHGENLYREVFLRLTERNRYSIALRRYGVRAERYDRERLRQLVASNPGRVEAVLAVDCAKYLFDCGFDVFTEVVLGNVRADMVAPDLYVEAKQIGDTASARGRVLGGYRQILGSARRLRDRLLGTPPLALVVFLVGGTRIEAPELVPAWHGSPAVRVHFVDLRAELQGADEGRPVVVTLEDFYAPADPAEGGG